MSDFVVIDLAKLPPIDPPPAAAPRFVTEFYARLERDDTFTLLTDFVYESALTGRAYVMPAGFSTDFASVPRLPLVFLFFGDTAKRAATLHDYLYRTGLEPRKVADRLFAEAMKATGVPAWRRGPMYAGVRIGGRGSHVGTAQDPTRIAAPDAPASSAGD